MLRRLTRPWVNPSLTNRHTHAREIPCFFATCRSDIPAACSRHDDGDDGWRLRLAESVGNLEFRSASAGQTWNPKFPVSALTAEWVVRPALLKLRE